MGPQNQMGGVCEEVLVFVITESVISLPRVMVTVRHQAENHVELQLSQQPQNIRVSLFIALLWQQTLCCHGYNDNCGDG